jgi:hypothetical protein
VVQPDESGHAARHGRRIPRAACVNRA